ncbi:Kinesin-like protein CIN8 [Labeo rohita]|uniref:Kinesin-like protein CIN8 n=1 Tax=Labeo rohita TaxID=84645 RepID=A0ABQ8L6P8_LABRO|nr:Kinesin-like protein CIN8 [Labeo rohita]
MFMSNQARLIKDGAMMIPIPTYPTSVHLYNVHNHNIFVAEALRHKDVGVEATEALTQLFEIGYSPTSALAMIKSDLLAEHGNKYVYASANHAIYPDLRFCYRHVKWYKSVALTDLCSQNNQFYLQTLSEDEYAGEGMLAALARQVEPYNAACNDTCAKLKMSSTTTPLVAICYLLMKRTHSQTNSGEMCFMDSSGNMDRDNCGVFLLLTHTGDDSKAEKGATAQVFPEATLHKLCIFHLLQAVWRWFWNKEHKIDMKDSVPLGSFFKVSLVGENKFQVRSSTSRHTYTVDMELELCTCPADHCGAPCKHQAAVVHKITTPPPSTFSRQLLK